MFQFFRIKFTPNYGKIQVFAERREGQLLILIKDTGIGIAVDKLPYIFDRFYQSDASSTRRQEGTGIGLALVKELVQLMNGKIIVESELGKGTTFRLLLPIHNQATKGQAIINKKEIRKQPPPKMSINAPAIIGAEETQTTLLVIEDNADVISYIQTCLKRDYQILTAKNGKEGIMIAQKELPTIILSDVMMPEMDGYEVCQQLKENQLTSHIPIILLTAKATQQDKIEGLSYGADAYLTKPFDKEELLIRLAKLVEVRRQLHQRFAQGLLLKEQEKPSITLKDEQFLNQLQTYIQDHIEEENIETVRLQKVVKLSRSQLHNKLKALTGMTTSQFRKTIRLQEGRKLLQSEEDLTVAEVAYKVGYKHPSHFSRDFKELFGVVPGILKNK